MQNKATIDKFHQKLPKGWSLIKPILPFEVVSAELEGTHTIVRPVVIARDAAGVIWKIQHTEFLHDLAGHQHGLPEVFPALYHLRADYLELYVEADSPAEACRMFTERFISRRHVPKVVRVYVNRDTPADV